MTIIGLHPFVLMSSYFCFLVQVIFFAGLVFTNQCLIWFQVDFGSTVLFAFLKADVVLYQKLNKLGFVIL